MEFFSGVMVGLIIGVVVMCLMAIIPVEDDDYEMDIEEETKYERWRVLLAWFKK